jgi:nucleotide-binding universal stress UspA family protein
VKAIRALTRVDLKNILICTDFSQAAADAFPYAAEMARHFEARLEVFHVRPRDLYSLVPPQEWAEVSEAADEAVREKAQKLLGPYPGIKHEVVIADDEIWTALQSEIEKKNIDLIVIGTHGRTGIAKLVLGSVAEEIFRQAPCAVLTVGPFTPREPQREGEISDILFATDFSPESMAAAPYAFSLAQEYQARLTLLHVIERPQAGELVVSTDLMPASERLLHNLVPPEAELWCEPKCVVERGDSAEKILDVAERTRADLIVLGVRRPSGVAGAATHLPIATAHKVVSRARCPVLTVRG